MSFDETKVLAGPILRRCDEHVINIWIATTKDYTFSAQIFSTTDTGRNLQSYSFASVSERWKLGQNLFVHIISVSAKSSEGLRRVDRIIASYRDNESRYSNLSVTSVDIRRARSTNLREERFYPTETRLTYAITATLNSQVTALSDLIDFEDISMGNSGQPQFFIQAKGAK